MNNGSSKDTRETVAYVEALQNAVQKASKNRDDLKARVSDANGKLASGGARKPKVSLGVYSEGGSEKTNGSLRVTCASRSVASAEIPDSLSPAAVEFYLTRTRVDGLAETRSLGTAKYKDGDGKWNVRFTTERFTRRPDDPLVLHAEVSDRLGNLVAGHAIPVVD